MKFYEFNDYEYYALIVAEDSDKAKLGYEEFIVDIEDEEIYLEPDVISIDEALDRYKCGKIEGCNTEEDKIKDFYKAIDYYKEYVLNGDGEYICLLVDSSLI